MARATMVLLLCASLGLVGCSGLTQADRDFAKEVLGQSGANCIHFDGGSVAATIPMLGAVTGGGYRGSFSAAHSEDSHAKLSCDTAQSSTEFLVTPPLAPSNPAIISVP